MNTRFQSLLPTVALLAISGTALSAAAEDGLTWTKRGTDDLAGVVTVGCGFTPGVGNQCDPYVGDMDCNARLPVLCFYDAGLPLPAHVVEPSVYYQWSGGIVGTTEPIEGFTFDHIDDANNYCVEQFGEGWRVAEHHDGWGWNFIAYGNVGDNANEANRRLWVDINNQPNGTCWDH
ncbi:MAG: flagellar hook-length control protein [Myxococcales bacterium FL481]|nr:MAG: flagellar hook-length control protein [Myxococcales bacterium FL481]